MWGGIKNTINESEGNSGVELNLLFMSRLQKYLDNPLLIGYALLMHYGRWIPDRAYLKLQYYFYMGKRLDLRNPKTFTEKIQWLKLYNRKDEYHRLVDKYEVKDVVASIIGEEYVIPTLGVWDSFDEIDFSKLPDQFVLKTTNGGGGGGVIVCKNKEMFNKKDARTRLNRSLATDLYSVYREWSYKNMKKRIIAEQYLEDETGELRDYKFFCFHGKVKMFKIDFDRFICHHANYYDIQGNILPFGESYFPPVPDKKIELPTNLVDMISISEKLSKNIPFLRVDLYNVNGKIYFGELTFYPSAGLGCFTPEEWDLRLGELIKLDGKN